MTNKLFLKKENMQLLWDIVSDEDNFKFLTLNIQSKIYNIFYNNIQGFYETNMLKIKSLVELNKIYILLIQNYINTTYPNNKPNKIKIYSEITNKEPITYEEIQTNRNSQINKDYIKRQEDFEDTMNIKIPPVPEFSIPSIDGPIKEMDKILKEMTMQRNYDVEQINKLNDNIGQNNNWLKSQNTSLKNEKFESGTKNIELETKKNIKNNYDNYDNSLKKKGLNNLTQEIDFKKNVSWSNSDEIQLFNIEDEQEDNIFAKLKMKNNENNNENNNANNNINIEIEEIKPNYNLMSFNEDKILELGQQIKLLNNKMDTIINLLNVFALKT